jgi:acetoin utilization deacetylase AcuC-like enzyme
MHRTGIAFDSVVMKHDPGPGLPEQPARYSSIIHQLVWSGLLPDLIHLEARSASDDELALAHAREYIALVEREVAAGRQELSTGDTSLNAYSAEAARHAVGLALSAVDAVFGADALNAFCVTRPPGHHASSRRGMGFCLFNTVAIAGRYAQSQYNAERVLIADWDVHHGNGTQDIFYADGSVLFFSTHQSPWYPGTGAASEKGEGAGEGATINAPFAAGAGREEILGAFRARLLPAAAKFRPDVVLISAGFDSRINDPLGQFRLTDDDFRDLTSLMMEIADQYSDGRLVSVLEGGYNLEGLAKASEAHVRALIGDPNDASKHKKLG